MPKKRNNVDIWLVSENSNAHVKAALENASRYFDEKDPFTVHTLEAMYGQESSFGTQMKERGIVNAAGHFQIERVTAKRYGMTTTKSNDQRFDIDDSAAVAARYLKDMYSFFSKATVLAPDRKTVAVKNPKERTLFAFAAYNIGEGRTAVAQKLSLQTGRSPDVWLDVREFLIDAGATVAKAKETIEYVEKVPAYEIEFIEKSSADEKAKDEKPKKIAVRCDQGHWRTKDGKRIFICD